MLTKIRNYITCKNDKNDYVAGVFTICQCSKIGAKVVVFGPSNKNLVPSCHFCAFLLRFLMILFTERGS